MATHGVADGGNGAEYGGIATQGDSNLASSSSQTRDADNDVEAGVEFGGGREGGVVSRVDVAADGTQGDGESGSAVARFFEEWNNWKGHLAMAVPSLLVLGMWYSPAPFILAMVLGFVVFVYIESLSGWYRFCRGDPWRISVLSVLFIDVAWTLFFSILGRVLPLISDKNIPFNVTINIAFCFLCLGIVKFSIAFLMLYGPPERVSPVVYVISGLTSTMLGLYLGIFIAVIVLKNIKLGAWIFMSLNVVVVFADVALSWFCFCLDAWISERENSHLRRARQLLLA